MLNLTTQEKKVILFLISAALLSAGTDFLLKTNSRAREVLSLKDQFSKIDLNSADKDALMSVSGIGAKLADRIIEYRQASGGFSDNQELKSIKGMTEARFEKIKDTFVVRR
ncbi:MAG: helix-hairpin-helix domain-containing protein [Candidatus Omnitrophica bacterium]|nr:helix-hairpin-helix domain-containing protein [Candidatus Omnitrophota bacterium]